MDERPLPRALTTDPTARALVTSDAVIAALVPHLPIGPGAAIQRLTVALEVSDWTTLLQWQAAAEVGTLVLTGVAPQQVWWDRLRSVARLPETAQACQVALVAGQIPVWTLRGLVEAVDAD